MINGNFGAGVLYTSEENGQISYNWDISILNEQVTTITASKNKGLGDFLLSLDRSVRGKSENRKWEGTYDQALQGSTLFNWSQDAEAAETAGDIVETGGLVALVTPGIQPFAPGILAVGRGLKILSEGIKIGSNGQFFVGF